MADRPADSVYRELLSALAAHKEEAEIADIAASWAMRLLNAEGACVTRVEGDELVHVVGLGVSARLKGMRAPIGHTFTGRVLLKRRAAFFAPDRVPSNLPERNEWFGMGSGLIVPIASEGRAVGTLAVSSPRERAFTAQHLRMLVGLARFLSLNLVVAQANELRLRYTRHLITAQEADRAHVARELHDETGQSLTAVLVRLKHLEDEASDPKAQRELADVRLLVSKTLEDVGRLARGLRPAALERGDFETVVRAHAQDYARANGFTLDMQVTGFSGAERLSPQAELALYRVVQEALTNVVRHARAKNVSLVLQRSETSVRVIAEDDGIGFDPAETANGMGLSGLRERVSLFEGRFMVESQLGQGTTLIVDLPMEAVRRVENPAADR